MFGAHISSLGLDLPFDEVVEPAGVLAQPITINDATAGQLHVPNRFAVLPMEGWDGTPEGRPTDLVRRRWQRFAEGGAGLVWAEATAVCHEGRANPHQLLINDTTAGQLAALRRLFNDGQVAERFPIGVGTGDTPTPGGEFYIKELLQPPNPNGSYGTYAYGLSGYSDVLQSFNGGSGVVGIHGTNDDSTIGRDVSHGCIRLHNSDIEKLVGILPLGVPVEIRA